MPTVNLTPKEYKRILEDRETSKKKQDRRIETIIAFIKKTWDEDWTPSQIQLLVYGRKTGKVRLGFKTYEALWEFIRTNTDIKPKEGLFPYLVRCSMDERTTAIFGDKAWRNKKPQLIGEILKGMADE